MCIRSKEGEVKRWIEKEKERKIEIENFFWRVQGVSLKEARSNRSAMVEPVVHWRLAEGAVTVDARKGQRVLC